MTEQRYDLVTQWAHAIDRAARSGALFGDASKAIALREIGTIAGPRAGAIEIDAGLGAGRLLRALVADDGAIMRQFVPWPFVGDPIAYMSGRCVRLEAGWPDHLAERSIRVTDLSTHPGGSGRWLCGKNEHGRAVTLGLSDNAPHFLIAGTTGSGKSVALRSMIVQFSRAGDQLVLIDLKHGEGLRDLDRLPGAIGPLAITIDEARSALGWAVTEMDRRYEQHDTIAARLVIVIDEVQELADDPICVEALRKLTAQGRAARVSVILATQHPTIGAFGDPTIKRNVTGRIALRVADAKSSEVAIGQSTPRADHLLGAGDAYALVPSACQRVQIAYMPKQEIARSLGTQPAIAEWPAFVAEQLNSGAPAGSYSGQELAISLIAATQGNGRPALVKNLISAGLPKPGSERAARLLALGREQNESLIDQGYTFSPIESEARSKVRINHEYEHAQQNARGFDLCDRRAGDRDRVDRPGLWLAGLS